jgi:predicted lipoprotein with Yx(FWY)xxD motif
VRLRRASSALIVPAVVLGVAACGSSSHHKTAATKAPSTRSTASKPYTPSTTPKASTKPATSGPATVDAKTIAGLGSVLVGPDGKTLYIFAPDKDKKVTCVGGCAAVWPPLKATGKLVAGKGVKQSLLGADPNPSGGKVVTYAGWPLYYYVADSKPGVATGQAIKLNGGLWYTISPAGTVIKSKPAKP